MSYQEDPTDVSLWLERQSYLGSPRSSRQELTVRTSVVTLDELLAKVSDAWLRLHSEFDSVPHEFEGRS